MKDNEMLLGEMHSDIKQIKEQVTRTNGRVTALEKWRWIITGCLIALGAMSFPSLSALAKIFAVQ